MKKEDPFGWNIVIKKLQTSVIQENFMDIKKLKESRTVEFKYSFGKEVIISLVAFANTRGGKVVLGLDDKGRVTGIELGPETEQKYINEIKTATYPQLIPHSDIHEIEGKTILVFEINLGVWRYTI